MVRVLLLCACFGFLVGLLPGSEPMSPMAAAEAAVPEVVRLYVIGDSQDRPEVHDAVCRGILADLAADPAKAPSVLVHVGDLTSNGDREEVWEAQYFNPASVHARRLEQGPGATWPCRGNHDGDGVLLKRHFRRVPWVDEEACWYVQHRGPVQVVVVDQYAELAPGSPQHAWLDATLAACPGPWKVVVCHEPGWTAGDPRGENPAVQQVLQPLLVKHGVALLLAGHRHYYARCRVAGVQHLTTGGAGGAEGVPGRLEPGLAAAAAGPHFLRIDADAKRLVLTARSAEGALLDRATLLRFRGRILEAWPWPVLLAVALWGAGAVLAAAFVVVRAGDAGWSAALRPTRPRSLFVLVALLGGAACLALLPGAVDATLPRWLGWLPLVGALPASWVLLRLGTGRTRLAAAPSLLAFVLLAITRISELF